MNDLERWQAAIAVILTEYEALRLTRPPQASIEQLARTLVRIKGLKIKGKIGKFSVATALKPDFDLGYKPDKPLPIDKTKAFYDSWQWKQLSYAIKLERGRQCECCGAKPPAVRIRTDHIKPIRRYWALRLEPSNLQVLCDACNKGKGSHDESDFRPDP